MNTIRQISAADVAGKLDWPGVVAALEAGHKLPRPKLGDQLLQEASGTLLSRSAWVDGLGIGVKSVTIMPNNPNIGLPTVHGGMLVFDDRTGKPEALIDSDVVTHWKTAGDSVLGARLLARPAPRTLLILGAGIVAASLVEAYGAMFPSLEHINVWNRTPEKAETLAGSLKLNGVEISAVTDLPAAAANADIVATATMARDPILHGDWIRPGTHIDLIGAFTPEMREADDNLLQKSRLFVDCRDTVIDHIGEVMIPMASGAISRDAVQGDLYDLIAGAPARLDEKDITVFKNGGGAHLDLMTARYILAVAEAG